MAKIKFYFDEHMPRAVQTGVMNLGYVVIMAVDVAMAGKDDDTEHLPYAAENNAVIFTRDSPFAGRVMQRSDHAGLICWTGRDDDFGGILLVIQKGLQKFWGRPPASACCPISSSSYNFYVSYLPICYTCVWKISFSDDARHIKIASPKSEADYQPMLIPGP